MTDQEWWRKNEARALRCLTTMTGLDTDTIVQRLGPLRWPAPLPWFEQPPKRGRGRPSIEWDARKVRRALEKHGGNVRATARALKVPRSTLTRWIRDLPLAEQGENFANRATHNAKRVFRGTSPSLLKHLESQIPAGAKRYADAAVRRIMAQKTRPRAKKGHRLDSIISIEGHRGRLPEVLAARREADNAKRAERARRKGLKPDPPPEPTVPITGNTYGVRAQLRDLGGTWDPAAKAWLVPRSKAKQAKLIVAQLRAVPRPENPPDE